MDTLRRNLKQMLIDKQEITYREEVKKKHFKYDNWIRTQEKKVEIDRKFIAKKQRNLTNEFKKYVNEWKKRKNEGNDSLGSEEFQWINMIERSGQFQKKKIYLLISACEICRNIDYYIRKKPDIILIKFYKGEVNQIAYDLIEQVFNEEKNVVLVYGDEDVKEGGTRRNPWFKPDWSPDRFLSNFYFGGLIAVRTEALEEAYRRCKEKGVWKEAQENKSEELEERARETLYLLFYEMLKRHNGFVKGHGKSNIPVFHIRQVLYHSEKNGYRQIKDLKLPFYESSEEDQEEVKDGNGSDNNPDYPMISIIIPSRDNPEVLFHCLDSFIERTHSKYPFEIILVDNGSCEENRKKISDKILWINQSFIGKKSNIFLRGCTYLYQPMTFNFSKMCNLGAESAKGELLLFLNDDMEIIQSDWAELMAEKALLPYAGAVGVKLLYPDSDIIQHAGVTNLRVGPAHKLQFLSDKRIHYFGMNRGVHNMLAVTGACLMLSKKVFDEVNGFCEKLAVAFNDIDLCYKVYERGYYNIERNDVVLYHHESFSRGKDGESPEKQLRLSREKDLLYEMHEDIYGKDPFYNPRLTTDMAESEYSPIYRYQVDLDMPWAKAIPIGKEVQKAREDKCLVVGMECAMDIFKWRYGGLPKEKRMKPEPDDIGYYFQGYSFIIGSNNACYGRKLLLRNKNDGNIFSISVDNRYRKDIKDNLKDQRNVELTGFVARVRREEIPDGAYQLGMLAWDKCSRQKLVNWSNWTLVTMAGGKESRVYEK